MSTLRTDNLTTTDTLNSVTVLEIIEATQLEGKLDSVTGGSMVRLASGETVEQYTQSLAGASGATRVGYDEVAHVLQPTTVAQAISNQSRVGLSGIFTTKADLPGARFGDLAYRKSSGGSASLITNLAKFYPAGAFAEPFPAVRTELQFTPAAFVATGSADVYRSVNTSNDFWGIAGGETRQATVIDASTGRQYLDSRFYPGADYSASVVNSSGFGGLTVEIKQPAGVPAPTTIVVKLSYPVGNSLKAVYVDPVNGNNTFDGTSMQWPVKDIATALTKAPAVVWLAPAIYNTLDAVGTYTSSANIAFKALGGRATFVSRAVTGGTWSVSSGNVYVKTVPGSGTPVGVVDLTRSDEFGIPDILVPVASQALVATTPKSFFYDSGPRLMYIQTRDGGVPSNGSVFEYGSASTLRHSGDDAKVYASDIDFIGGTGGAISAREGTASSVLITERCRFLGNYNSNGSDVQDIGICIHVDGLAAYNNNDGFNYTGNNGISPHFIEINCVSLRHTGSGTSNGTTSHNDCIGFRLGTDVTENAGPGFADVGQSKTVNVNVTSTNNTGSSNSIGFTTTDTAVMILDGATGYGNQGGDLTTSGSSLISARELYATSITGSVSLYS